MLLLLAQAEVEFDSRVVSDPFLPPFININPPSGRLDNPPATTAILNTLKAKKIKKRTRLTNKNTSSMQAGLEMDPDDRATFFDSMLSTELFENVRGIDEIYLDEAKESATQLTNESRQSRRDIEEVQYAIRDLQNSVKELQDLQVSGAATDEDNLAKHGEVCELMDGQFLRFESPRYFGLIAMEHGLDRVPQGYLMTANHLEFRVLVEGKKDWGVPQATKKVVYIYCPTPAGTKGACILF